MSAETTNWRFEPQSLVEGIGNERRIGADLGPLVGVLAEQPQPVGELACLEGHGSPVVGVVFSSDGRLALSGSSGESKGPNPTGGDKTLRLWDMETKREIRRMQVDTGLF